MQRWAFLPTSAVFLAALVLGSCGQPGSPQPPSLELPKAADDVTATRKGDRVTIRWTTPSRFTDGHTIRHLGPTHICRVPGQSPAATCTVVGTLPAPPEAPRHKSISRLPMEYVDVLPSSLIQASPTADVMYGVEILNIHGRSVGVSTQVPISTAPALPPPAGFAATVGNDGITLQWQPIPAPSVQGISFAYQIERRGENGDFAPVGTVPIDQTTYLDQTFEWEKKFAYRILVLTESATKQVLVEGIESPAVTVFAHDVYPPAAPHDLQAVFSGPGQQFFIDLSWAPNLEPDLAGYNVYRHEEGASPVKINAQLVTAPSFRDEHVEPGKQYLYSVSAVDLRGNESARSAEAGESVPR